MATKPNFEDRGSARGGVTRREAIYRQLRIVAGTQGERAKAFAYQGGRKFLAADGTDVADAVERLIQSIDAVHEQRVAQRTHGAPSPEEYADALARIGRHLTPIQDAMIARHAGLPEGRARLRHLADQFGITQVAAQRAYARLGRYVADILDYEPTDARLGKAQQPILVLAEPIGEADDELEWALRASLVTAVVDSRNPVPIR